MLRVLNTSTERFLANLEAIQRRVETAQQQISSGRKLVRPSDDPDQVSTMLQARADLEQTRQIRKDLARVKTEVDTAEQSLQQTALLMDRIRVLGTQGINGTQTPESRATIAAEIEALFGQLVNISRTSVDGRYIFSGDSDQTSPYTLDLTQPNGVSLYAGTAATRATRHPSGTIFLSRKRRRRSSTAPPRARTFSRLSTVFALRCRPAMRRPWPQPWAT
jgi:flagellar hook-associated protein 3 FlgL